MQRSITLILILALANVAHARTQLKNICRVKGQEENILRGLGLVVGLNGTGEANDGPTMRAMATAMQIMGSPLQITGPGGQQSFDELKKFKNAALVMVTATIPATGARRGDKLDCYISAINGKSLVGGRLAFASMQGPNTNDPRVYALCQGQVVVENEEQPMVGVIHGGCQMEADVYTKFYKEEDGTITLVLEKNHANFQTASDVARQILDVYWRGAADSEDESGVPPVYAKDAANIIVTIPPEYHSHPVDFASDILGTMIYQLEPEARVTINPRAGSIVIAGNVEIGEVAVSHRNVTVEATASNSFTGLSTIDPQLPKLQELVKQLDRLKISTDDMIEIVRGIERSGKLHGRLIIE